MNSICLKKPLIHCITNYVTINDVANVILGVGAKPIMAEDINEVADIISIADALLINTGMIDDNKINAMIAAGKHANIKGLPIVLDPVGIGASNYRMNQIQKLISEINFTVIKGNLSEIKSIADKTLNKGGVDVDPSVIFSLEETAALAKKLSQQLNCIIVITGKLDVISNGIKTVVVHNGHEKLSSITGTGCMLGGILASFIALSNDPLTDVINAVSLVGLAGQNAALSIGNINFKHNFMNNINLIDEETLLGGQEIEFL